MSAAPQTTGDPRAPLRLSREGPAVLAFGAWFKNTLCLAHRGEALLSETLGDLDNPEACRALEATAEQLLRRCRPAAIAHDLHPDFHSSRVAVALAERLGVPAVPVQHHHAHVAAVLAEHGHDGPALGLALDGVGLGTDATAWGGELLRVDGARFERLGHLRPLPLPGGDRAAREPWRMAAAVLHLAGRGDEIGQRFHHRPAAAQLAALLERARHCPPTSSMGRWFDAAAGLLGVCEVMDFEAEAAIGLERLASAFGESNDTGEDWRIDEQCVLDLLPLLVGLADETDAARGAARFHATLIRALEAWMLRTVAAHDLSVVAFSGGCFHNRILSSGLGARLRAQGLRVLEARQLSPGDAGLALGQARVAMHLLEGGA